MSPELLDPEEFGLKESHPTKQSDCYALGVVIYEVLTGKPPFAGYRNAYVVRMVLSGKRPPRPEEEGNLFTDETWEVVERCWKKQPGDRPSAKDVLSNGSYIRDMRAKEGSGTNVDGG
jgi:serine/threonine protein kinase